MLRVGAYGNFVGTQAEIVLYGLSKELMAMLSSKGTNIWTQDYEKIHVTVYANEVQIFSGFIVSSYPNMNAIPEVPLIITAQVAFDLQIKPSSPFSAPGTVKLKDVLSAICSANDYKLNAININGITASNIHLVGSPMEQIRAACSAANLSVNIQNNVVSVWDTKGKIDDVIPEVSPENGLIGYPVPNQFGITFQTQFSSLLSQGRNVKLTTSVPNLTGIYNLYLVEHMLSSWMENGPWHSVCQATRVQNG